MRVPPAGFRNIGYLGGEVEGAERAGPQQRRSCCVIEIVEVLGGEEHAGVEEDQAGRPAFNSPTTLPPWPTPPRRELEGLRSACCLRRSLCVETCHGVHPAHIKPELLAARPNQVWSRDITKLLGPVKRTYYYLYVVLDI